MPEEVPSPEGKPVDVPVEMTGLVKLRRVPPPSIWIAVAICLVLIIPVYLSGALLDHGVANVLSWTLPALAATIVFFWFVIRANYPVELRLTVFALAVGASGAAGYLLRFEDMSGELIPQFTYRWRPRADELLGPPQTVEGAVDLATTTDDDFPQFLGPQRNATLANIALDRDWEAHPPQLKWKTPIGAGWSGFAAVNGFAVTMEQRGKEELVSCYRIDDGSICWFHAIDARHETVMGGTGPRSTPTVDQGRVYALGATGVLRCLNGENGDLLWMVDLLQQIGVTPEDDGYAIAWGRSGSPLIVDDLVVIPLGGSAQGNRTSLVAFNKETGKMVWEAGTWQASYASPTLAVIHDVPQILSVNCDVVSSHVPKTGEILWQVEWPGDSAADASVSQPISLGDGRILLSKAYFVGAKLIRVDKADGTWQATELEANSRVLKTKFTNAVVRDGYAYALSDGILECVKIDGLQRAWKGGRYGQGQILAVDDLLLVEAESGEVNLVELTPDEHRPLGSFQALDGKTWNTLCLYGHLLLVRNGQQAACYELP